VSRLNPRRQLTGLKLRARRRRFLKTVELQRRDDLIHIGTHGYGGWTVPTTMLDKKSVVYLAGVGEDISFDLGAIARFGCKVWAFDPVPDSAKFAREAAAHEPRHNFMEIGLWSSDTTLKFHEPEIEGFISHSATNIHATDGFIEAKVRSVKSLMKELKHDHIDLLKVSAEGSEFEIVNHVLDEKIPVSILCVEIAQPAKPGEAEELVERVERSGMALVEATIRPWGWKVSFVKED
jgi:FkbM family methyltransferase